jgi:hypothetical protein
MQSWHGTIVTWHHVFWRIIIGVLEELTICICLYPDDVFITNVTGESVTPSSGWEFNNTCGRNYWESSACTST